MKKSLIEKLCCPFDKTDLTLQIVTQDINNDVVVEGVLTCDHCRRYYPIIYGIPIMNPDEYREKHLELPILDRWKEKLVLNTDDGFTLLEPMKKDSNTTSGASGLLEN